MAIARKINGTWVLWDGKPFQHPQHPEYGAEWKPTGVENWSVQELSDAGLSIIKVVGDDPFDSTTQVKEGPVYTQDASGMTATFTVRAMTAPELDAANGRRIGGLQTSDLLKVILALENDNRLIKARINVLSPGSFTAAQAAQITMAQLITGLKALL